MQTATVTTRMVMVCITSALMAAFKPPCERSEWGEKCVLNSSGFSKNGSLLTIIVKNMQMMDMPTMEAQYGIPMTADSATLGV